MKIYGVVDVQIQVFLISALVGSGKLHALATLPSEKSLLPRKPSEPIWTMWRKRHFLPYRASNSDLWAVQPVASPFIDCVIPAPSQVRAFIFV